MKKYSQWDESLEDFVSWAEFKQLGGYDLSAKLSGTYSIRIKDPVVFYKNVVQRTVGGVVISTIKSQMESEVLTCLQPAGHERALSDMIIHSHA